MKVYTLLKKIHFLSLVEIIDKENKRLFYGGMYDMEMTTYNFIKRLNVEYIVPHIVDISENKKDCIIQIKVKEIVDNSIK